MLNTCQLTSGQTGSKKLPAHYGERLSCVRYCYAWQLRKHYKTMELIAEEAEWMPPPKPLAATAIAGVRVEFKETEVQRRIGEAGGRWNSVRKPWELRYDKSG